MNIKLQEILSQTNAQIVEIKQASKKVLHYIVGAIGAQMFKEPEKGKHGY